MAKEGVCWSRWINTLRSGLNMERILEGSHIEKILKMSMEGTRGKTNIKVERWKERKLSF